jgi:hypothetical protein
MIQRAVDFGFRNPELENLAARHLHGMGPSDTDWSLSDDEHEILSDGSDVAENWLNENVAPEGYSFGWHEGEFFLWSTETWAEPF